MSHPSFAWRPLLGALLPAAALSFGLAACGSDLEVVDQAEVRCIDQCQLTYNDLSRPRESKAVIENIGLAPLQVRAVRLEATTPHLRFTTASIADLLDKSDLRWRSVDEGRGFETNGATVDVQPGGGRLEFELQLAVPRGDALQCPNGNNAECGFLVVETNSRIGGSNDTTVRIPIRIDAGEGLVAVDPSVINFADPVAGARQSSTFNILNTGTGPLLVQEIALTGDGSDAVTITNGSGLPLPVEIAPLGSQVWNVEWLPTSTAPLDARATIRSNDATGNVVVVNIRSGQGASPVLDVTPCGIEFQEAVTGQPNDATFDVGNTGGAPMNFSINVANVQPPAARDEFVLRIAASGDGGVGQQAPLAQGQTRTYRLTYTPTEERSISGELVFSGNFTGTTRRCSFRAGPAAPEILVIPQQLYWGNVDMGASEDRQFIVSNQGLAPLIISDVTLTETGDTFEEFALEAGVAGGFTLDPGADRAITVTYTRAAADVDAPDRATVFLNSNDPLAPRERVDLEVNHGGAILPPTCVIEITPEPEYNVGNALTFDATGSSLADGSTWVPSGRFTWGLRSPTTSGASLNATTGDTVTLTPDVPGGYSVTLTATAAFGGTQVNCQLTRNFDVRP